MTKRVLLTPGPPLYGAALKSVKLDGNGKVVTIAAQQVEAYLRIGAMNKMTGLGMPESYPAS